MSPILFQAFRPRIADTAIVSAGLEIATDPTASSTTRALSLELLTGYVAKGDAVDHSSVQELTVGDVCPGNGTGVDQFYHSNLPSNELELVKARIASLERDASTPIVVRAASNCIMNAWRLSHGFPQQPILDYATIPVTLEYVCGTLFRIKNSGTYMLEVRAGVSGASPLPVIMVPSKSTGLSFGTADIEIHVRGATMEVWFDDQLLASQKSTGAGCP